MKLFQSPISVEAEAPFQLWCCPIAFELLRFLLWDSSQWLLPNLQPDVGSRKFTDAIYPAAFADVALLHQNRIISCVCQKIILFFSLSWVFQPSTHIILKTLNIAEHKTRQENINRMNSCVVKKSASEPWGYGFNPSVWTVGALSNSCRSTNIMQGKLVNRNSERVIFLLTSTFSCLHELDGA